MKALSIQQPWAALIAAGLKDIENRTWSTNYRGDFLIHAGQRFDMQAYMWLRNNFHQMGLDDKAACKVADLLDAINPKACCGGIVGIAKLVECVKEHASTWKVDGQYGFVLQAGQPLPFRPLKGKLGFFEVQS